VSPGTEATEKEKAMIRTVFAALAFAASAGVALAAATGLEAIKQRQELMKADGAAAKAVVAMLKGKAPFDLATVQKTLKTFENAASKEPALFPPDSKTGGKTEALPAIWEDDNMADFQGRFKKFGADATAADASIKDEASVQATLPGVLNNCEGCHEKYVAKQQ
jgi:cytochrome c556